MIKPASSVYSSNKCISSVQNYDKCILYKYMSSSSSSSHHIIIIVITSYHHHHHHIIFIVIIRWHLRPLPPKRSVPGTLQSSVICSQLFFYIIYIMFPSPSLSRLPTNFPCSIKGRIDCSGCLITYPLYCIFLSAMVLSSWSLWSPIFPVPPYWSFFLSVIFYSFFHSTSIRSIFYFQCPSCYIGYSTFTLYKKTNHM